MSTLITFRSSSGKTGRCDDRCYNAKMPRCDCICGGKNHGVGLNRAAEHTREWVETVARDYEATHPGQVLEAEISPVQYELFGGEQP